MREVVVLAAALHGSFSSASTPATRRPHPTAGRARLLLAVIAGATYAATTVLGHNLASRVDAVALNTCATTAGAVA